MAQMRIVPILKNGDTISCETCYQPVDRDGYAWSGQIDSEDGTFTEHCVSCMNVLARMADAVDDLQGPDGQQIRLNKRGDVER